MKTINAIIISVISIFLISSCCKKGGEYDATGVFEATEVIVSAEANGKIMDFNVSEGLDVSPNTTLGYIDTMQLYLKKQQILAGSKAVKSRYMDVNKQIASIKQQIQTLRTEEKRFETLVKNNAANQKQVDDIKAQILVYQKQLSAQEETIQNNNRSLGEENSSMLIQIQQIDDLLQKSRIKSTIAGTILTKYAEEGELANNGRALFKVADLNNIYLRAYITADQLNQLKLNQEVKVYADFGEKDNKEYSGRVSWISSKSEFTPKTIQTRDERANLVYAIKIAVKNDGYIKLGMYGELKLN